MKLFATLLGQHPQTDWLRLEESATEVHVSDAFLEALAMSHGDLATLLRTALRAAHPGDNTYVWTRDVYDEAVVYEISSRNEDIPTALYQRSYTITDGAVTFGDPIKVIAVTQYMPAETGEITMPATQVTQVSQPAAESGEVELTTDLVPLVEKAVKKDGTAKIKIIQAGQGSSGYYPADMLKRDGPKVFTEGVHVYLDHPTKSETKDRPERSVKDLAGSLTGPAIWEETGAAGPGLYAPVKFIDSVAPHINAIAPISGMSIRADGWGAMREVDGQKRWVIEGITAANSIDVVTKAGAGGKVLDLIESARGRTTTPLEEGADVDKAEFEATKTALAEAQTKLAELAQWKTDQEQRDQTAKLMREASAVITEALAPMQLPESVRTKVTTELTLNPPLKEGALDKEALTARAKERATEEYTYVIEAAGLTGRVIGMGGGPSDVDPKAELAAMFEANGHSKDVAARMAAR